MRQLRELSLFSGYGGFSLGLKLYFGGESVRTIGYCEIEPYCQEIIKARIKDGVLDDAPIWPDIRSADFSQLRGLVDVVTAGFPCQPHSVAGQRRGKDDERNLWPDTLRAISQVDPVIVLLENVPGIFSTGYAGVVIGELSEAGYDCEWGIVSASDVGASHRRDRWWCLAYTKGERDRFQQDFSGGTRGQQDSSGRQRMGQQFGYEGSELDDSHGPRLQDRRTESTHQWPAFPPGPTDADAWGRVLAERPELTPAVAYTSRKPTNRGDTRATNGRDRTQDVSRGRDESDTGYPATGEDSGGRQQEEAQSPVRGVVDGTAHRVHRLKALGNGIVPAVVAEFLRRAIG